LNDRQLAKLIRSLARKAKVSMRGNKHDEINRCIFLSKDLVSLDIFLQCSVDDESRSIYYIINKEPKSLARDNIYDLISKIKRGKK
jgi:hypothetical protein